MQSLTEAFRELIKHRKWHEGSGVDPRVAASHKSRFLHGKGVSENIIKKYLENAGYVKVQEEMWAKVKDNEKNN